MVAWAPAISAVGSLLGGLGGIFGRKKKQPSPRDNMMSQAAGARDAAAKYGFNPLTMLQYGQPAGTGIADAGPPLASIAMLTDGLSGLADEFSGDADHRRAQERLDYDIAKLKYDQLRTGIVAAGPAGTGIYTSRPNAADNIGGSLSPLGRNNGTRTQTISQAVSRGIAQRPPMHPQRKGDELIPVTYPDGARVMIPRGQADRLDIKPFQSLIGGDLEELRGEFVGNIETTARAPDMVTYSATGEPVDSAGSLEFDPNEKKWVPPLTDPNSNSWWKKPLW